MTNHVIPYTDTEFNKISSGSPREDHVEQVEEMLAEAYLDKGNGFFLMFLKVVSPFVVLDVLFPMSAQVYGLVISMVGTWLLLVDTDIIGRFTIASEAEYSTGATWGGSTHLDMDKARRLAENTAATNVGLVWLTLGFLFQILAVSFFPNENVVGVDLLQFLLT